MVKYQHEIRDPIHTFIRLDADERKVLDSRPMQRLRHIHQLAMEYLLYPGATHTRFEHSLGVMELASRVFDVVTDPENVTDGTRKVMPIIGDEKKKVYWRSVLRMAALCHDLGHPPFSHAAEKDLFPRGWRHERLTKVVVLSDEMCQLWKAMDPPLRPEDIVKLAIGRPKAEWKAWAGDLTFNNWEAILSEIVTGDAFGTDRMDYLLRDSYYAGVAYGRFDHHRLIDTLRILPSIPDDEESAPELGVDDGGRHAAESLVVARYFMFTQVYLHPIRLIYDRHLVDFLRAWLPNNEFPTDVDGHLALTDNNVTEAMWKASLNERSVHHELASRILQRKHFRRFYERTPADLTENLAPGPAIRTAASRKFGKDNIRYAEGSDKGGSVPYMVQTSQGRFSSSSYSTVKLPSIKTEYVFVTPAEVAEADRWLGKNRTKILKADAARKKEKQKEQQKSKKK